MPVTIEPHRIQVQDAPHPGLTLPIAALPTLWKWHVDDDPLSAVIDRAAARFVRAGFPAARAFLLVRTIYAWGGLRGANPDHVMASCRKLRPEGLSRILAEAHAWSLRGEFERAITLLRPIKGMKVSFHSKILRFLCPDHAAVLDSRIVEACGYPAKPIGYGRFVTDCRAIRDHLTATGVHRADGRPWRATDVEMAIFAKIKQNLNEQKNQAA